MREEAGQSSSPNTQDLLAEGSRVGDYVVESLLGVGGMAAVYGGRHPLIGRRVAIKVIRSHLCRNVEAVERFVQEAQAVTEIGHPNIVDVFNFGNLENGRSYFIMEWLDGRTLAEVLDVAALPLPKAAAALIQICDALEAAHRAGIVHRDLKPQNVFFLADASDRPTVKLLDFGIAKLVGRPERRTTQTQPGLTVGTPDYISPEQARGQAVGGASDIYSLGILAFEMLTRELPFVADNAADMMAMHLSSAPRLPSSLVPTLPRGVDELIASMLEKDPAARPTADEVRAKLAALIARPARLGRKASDRLRGVGVAAFAAIVGVALLMAASRVTPLVPATSGMAASPVPPPPPRALPPPPPAWAPAQLPPAPTAITVLDEKPAPPRPPAATRARPPARKPPPVRSHEFYTVNPFRTR